MSRSFRRIVVKIGTNSLMKDDHVNKETIKSLASELSMLRAGGKEIILVSSGAIGFGIETLGIGFPKDTKTQQAMAAIGQRKLMHEYGKAFEANEQIIAQLLLTHFNFSNKDSFQDLSNAIETLLSLGVIPIINENDAVSIEALSEEKTFSDNDGLATLVAINFKADLLVLLTDVDGIYTDNPKKNANAEKISSLRHLLGDNIVIGDKSTYGLGGMKSKISAVKKALESGVSTAVCKARPGAVSDVLNNVSNGSVFRRDAE